MFRTKTIVTLILNAVAVLTLWAVTSAVCKASDPWEPYRAVCEIRVLNSRGAVRWTGSGTLVARTRAADGQMIGLVNSCRHVNPEVGMKVLVVWHGWGIEKATDKPPQSFGMVAHVVQGAGDDWGTDLAVVMAPVPENIRPVPVARFDPANGPWMSAGYRGGKFYYVMATEAYAQGSAIVLNSPFVKGQSGGVTFDRFGRQVGVVVASNWSNVGWSADGENMANMLKQFGR